jgi:hypothetical protein
MNYDITVNEQKNATWGLCIWKKQNKTDLTKDLLPG